MFSDTHFHFKSLCQNDAKTAAEILKKLCDCECFFAMDIGTKSGDLFERQKFTADAFSLMPENYRQKAEKMIYFSAGIWPAAEAISNREAELKKLRTEIEYAQKNCLVKNAKIVAVGECGLDHHWNKEGVDERDEAHFTKNILAGEAEMFEMQLELARELNLPVIVHSRDAFDGTLSCIKNIGYDNGIIHCYSYGADEARAFTERGWYISFSGSVTYTKKSNLELMKKTINAVPAERLLLETDSPYLSPVPLRGQKNTPLNVLHTYKYVAEIRGISVEELSTVVDENCKRLFGI